MGVRIAVVGLAWVGQQHARRVAGHPEAELVAVCDLLPDLAESTAADLGTRAFTSVEEMLHATRPEAIVLCTPPRSHPALTQVCAAMGCHVFAEKPMASSLDGCDQMIAVCHETERVLMVGHKKRFLGAYQRLAELLGGELGAPGFFLYRYPHPYVSEKDWFWDEADGRGPLFENAIHAAHLINWLFGPVERVRAEASPFLFPHRAPQANCGAMTFRIASGCVGALGAGMVSTLAFDFEDLYVATEGGVAEVSGPFDSPDRLRWARRDETTAREERYPDDPFTAELSHFLHCIREGAPPLVGGAEGRDAVELALRWKDAARETAVPSAG